MRSGRDNAHGRAQHIRQYENCERERQGPVRRRCCTEQAAECARAKQHRAGSTKVRPKCLLNARKKQREDYQQKGKGQSHSNSLAGRCDYTTKSGARSSPDQKLNGNSRHEMTTAYIETRSAVRNL